MTPTQQAHLERYVRSTARQLRAAIDAPVPSCRAEDTLAQLLNGVPSASINRILGRRRRRADGIYFSGELWAKVLAEHVPVDRATRIFDPACGIGDLLVAAARRLPLASSIETTLQAWAAVLGGNDLHASFTAVAWNRLRALAVQRHGDDRARGVDRIVKPRSWSGGNALTSDWKLAAGHCVVMNPPFNPVAAPSWSKFCSGRVTAAMPFLEKALVGTPGGVTIVAIVPEVVRSGSRFDRFRSWMRQHCDVLTFEPKGQFGDDADIDVALLVVRTREANPTPPEPVAAPNDRMTAQGTLGASCKVNVGSVVPHRTAEDGPPMPYLTVVDAKPWSTIEATRRRGYVGKGFVPPFIAVHRTSSPSDKERVRATIVIGDQPVLVENHLIVLTPHEATQASCQSIMRSLRRPAVSSWLNERIRCRHLTVSAVAQIPVDPAL